MSYLDLFHAIVRRWRMILAILLACLGGVTLWTMLSPKQYQATASLLFDFADNGQPAGPTSVSSSSASQAAMLGTQANIIRSDQVASQLIESARLADNPALRAQWEREVQGRLSFERWLADRLLSSLWVLPIKNSNVLQIGYISADAGDAALFANGFADAFVTTQLRLRTEPAKVYSDWFGMRIRDARAKLERAQARLTAFQQRHGLIGGEKLDVELSHLSDLTGQLAIAEAAAAEAGARARSGGAASPEVQMSGTVTSLRSAAALKAAEVEQLAATLGPNHPQLQTAQAALAELRAKLGEAIGQATRSLGASSASSADRVGALRQRLGAQRGRVLRLSAVQDELEVLQRDVNAAKADYDGITQSLSAARLRAQIPQTSVAVLDRAEPPLFPVSPDLRLRLLLAGIFGLLLGLGLTMMLEWRRPYVRTAEGLERHSGLPTLFVASGETPAADQMGRVPA